MRELEPPARMKPETNGNFGSVKCRFLVRHGGLGMISAGASLIERLNHLFIDSLMSEENCKRNLE
jgi:hypothetical protein